MFDPLYSLFYGSDEFIHTGYDKNFFRPLHQAGETISVAVDIDQFPVIRDGVCTHQKDVCHNRPAVEFPFFFRSLCRGTVQQRIGAVFDGIHQSAFFDGLRTAPGNGTACRDLCQDIFHHSFRVFIIESFDISFFQIHDDAGNGGAESGL